jgi:hypothetical protein
MCKLAELVRKNKKGRGDSRGPNSPLDKFLRFDPPLKAVEQKKGQRE